MNLSPPTAGRPANAGQNSPPGQCDPSEPEPSHAHAQGQAPRVMGAELWVKIGDAPPADPSELSFLALDTNTPYLAEYSGVQAGKKAHYMLRWVSTRGDKGPWSETVSATIGG